MTRLLSYLNPSYIQLPSNTPEAQPLIKSSVVQSQSGVPLFVTPWTAAGQSSLSSTVLQSLLKFMSIELMMLSNHLTLCHLLLLLPSIFPSIRVFPSELVLLIRWPKYCSFSFSILNSFPYSVSYACWITREIFCFCCLFAFVKQVTISEWFTDLCRFGIVFKFVLLLGGNNLRFA